MKKRTCVKRILALAIAAVMLFSGNLAVHAIPAKADTTDDEHFFQALAQLVARQDSSDYFDSMELTIGSNILKVDETPQQMNAVPMIQGQQIMLPIQPIADAAGADVSYDEGSASAVITNPGGDEISTVIGSSAMTINGQDSAMDGATYILGGQIYMPVGGVAKALDMEVALEQSTATVTLTSPYQTCRVLAWGASVDTQGMSPTTVLHSNNGMWVLQFDTPSQAKDAVALLTARGVEAEPDRYIPPVQDQSAAEVSAQGSHHSWGVEACNFDPFINRYKSRFGSQGVVAVVDSGVDSGHAFLKGRVLSGYDFIDGDADPSDGHSHGTHVAGTIIDCVSSAPVRILPVRVLDNRGRSVDSIVVAGIKYAADRGADVINLSLGGGHSSSLDRMVSYAVSKGCLVAIAAGNDNIDTSYECPSHLTVPGTVIVSAGDRNRSKAVFSNHGNNVDLMAPGVSIRATVPGGGFGSMSGTSMATPHVAAAAILLDLAWGKTLDPSSLEAQLHAASSRGVWTDRYMGYGFLDLAKVAPPGGPDPDPKPNPTPDPKPDPNPDPSPDPKPNPDPTPDPEPEPEPAPLPSMPGTEGMNLTLGEPWLKPSYYTRGDNGLIPRYTKVTLSLGCAYRGPAPVEIDLYIKRENGDWSGVYQSYEIPSGNPFRFSTQQRVHGEPGETIQYKFVVTDTKQLGTLRLRTIGSYKGKVYESKVGSYTIPEKEDQ